MQQIAARARQNRRARVNILSKPGTPVARRAIIAL